MLLSPSVFRRTRTGFLIANTKWIPKRISSGATRMTSAYRQLPAVETLVQAIQRRANGDAPPHELLVEAARAELDAARGAIAAGAAAPTVEDLIGATLARSRNIAQPSLRPLINATGVII